MSRDRVLYATSGWGVHDARWTGALEACGFDVAVSDSTDGLRERAGAFEPLDAPVLAGPLTSVTRLLVGLERPIIGLSWGYDLAQGHSQSVSRDELRWIADLDGLVVDSVATRDEAIALGLSPDRIVLIPWGVDLDSCDPSGLAVTAADHGFPPDSRVILSMRTHDVLYRTADVIEAYATACAADPSLRLVMGGDGPLTAAHRSRVAELGLADVVRFIGRVDESDVPAVLRGADAYVTASETDGTSVTLLQAMACGTPVLASRIPGNQAWVVDEVTGRTFAVGDIGALAGLMATGATDTAVAGMTGRARALVEREADWRVNRLRLGEMLRGLGPETHR